MDCINKLKFSTYRPFLKTKTILPMQSDLSQWYEQRLKNYAFKLQLSQSKALKRLMLFTDLDKLRREFDRIVDSKFWSSKEPGICYKQRKERLAAMFKPCEPEAIQLSLFKKSNRIYELQGSNTNSN